MDLVSSLASAVEKFSSLSVLVIGDVMWDHYFMGAAERISPEAPVPVVLVKAERGNLGGAGNVAANLRALGAHVELAGVIGDDQWGIRIRSELRRNNIGDSAVIVDPSRPTTVKLRIIARNQQVVRADWESREPLDAKCYCALLERAAKLLSLVDVVVVSDYGKGVISSEVIRNVTGLDSRYKMVLADPKGKDYSKYHGVTVLTPNELEAEQATGQDTRDDQGVSVAAGKLLDQLPSLQAVYITRGAQGIWVAPRGMRGYNVPAASTEVFDVTGAGDTVISVLALSLASGLDWRKAAVLANLAAGAVVRRLGCSTVTGDELLRLAHAGHELYRNMEAAL